MLIKLIAATSYPVTLEQARLHCRAPEDGDDDTLVERAMRSAVAYIEKHTSRALAPATFEYRVDKWPCNSDDIVLPRSPVRDVLSVEYLDEDGVLTDINEGDWIWRRTAEGASIWFITDYTLPTLYDDNREPIRITFTAGYDDPEASGSGDDPDLVLPPTLATAVLMLTAHYYDSPAAVVSPIGNDPKVVPLGIDALLAQERIYR